jgi:hypothetical protein
MASKTSSLKEGFRRLEQLTRKFVMSVFLRNLSIIFLGTSLSLVATSCAETKVSQCQKIIEITKKMAQESKNNRQTTDIKQVLQMADTFEEIAEDMEKIKIQDEQLIQYQEGFAEVYRSNAQATREFIDALQTKNIPAAKLTQKQVQEIGRKEQKLVTDMNSYCQAN